MATYVYTAPYATIYPSIPLTASPTGGAGGTPTVWNWASPPTDGRWAATALPVNDAADNGGPGNPGPPVVIVGSAGESIISGHGAPAAWAGSDGDYWMDVDATVLYGPRVAGSWPGSGTSLIGGGAGGGTDWLNVKTAYGAKGDGATVDSSAIQAAVNDAAAAGGGTVYVPAGTFICSGVYLASNVTIRGAGMGATVLKMDPAATPGTNAWVLRVANGSTTAASYVTVADLTIDGNSAAFPNPTGKMYGYYLGTTTVGTVTDCAINRVEFRNCPSYACDVVNALRVAITDCWSHNNGGTLGSFNACSGFEILADDVTVVNCRAMNNQNKGFISGESGVPHQRIKYIGCTAQANTSDGFYLHDGLTDSSILGGSSRDNGGSGVVLASASIRNTVVGVTCTGNFNNGIRLDTVTYNIVSACICDGNGTGSVGNPEIYLTNASNNTISTCLVNSMNSNTSIVEQGTSNFNTFRTNTINKTFTVLGANSTTADVRTGTATLVAGTVTVANTNVTATSKIFLSHSTVGGTLGELSYAKTAGTGFTITSTSTTDTSAVDWMIA